MSGGHWNYSHGPLRDALEQIARDEDVKRRWPTVAAFCRLVGDHVYDIVREMDDDLSSDSAISDDATFDRQAAAGILDAILTAAPDAWFPRGKWATIQAVQERAARA